MLGQFYEKKINTGTTLSFGIKISIKTKMNLNNLTLDWTLP